MIKFKCAITVLCLLLSAVVQAQTVIRPENLNLVGGYRVPTFAGVSGAHTDGSGYPWGGVAVYTTSGGDTTCWIDGGENSKQVMESTTSASMGTGSDPTAWPLMTAGTVWDRSDLFPGVSLTEFMIPEGLVYDHVNNRLIVTLRSRYATGPDPSQWLAAVDYPGKTLNATMKPDLSAVECQRCGGGMGILPAAWATTHTGGKRLAFISGGYQSGQRSSVGPAFGAMDLAPSATPAAAEYMYSPNNAEIESDWFANGWDTIYTEVERRFPDYGPVSGARWQIQVRDVGGVNTGFLGQSSLRGGGAFVDYNGYSGLVYFMLNGINETDYHYQTETGSYERRNRLYTYDISDVEDAVAGTVDPTDVRGRFNHWTVANNGGVAGTARGCKWDYERNLLWVLYARAWTSGVTKHPIIAAYEVVAATDSPEVLAGEVYQSGDLLAIHLNRTCSFASTPSTTGFTLKVNGSPVSFSYYAGDDTNYILFAPAATILSTDTVTLSFDSGTGDLQDTATTTLTSFTDLELNNTSEQGAADLLPPEVVSAYIDRDGYTGVVIFTEDVRWDGGAANLNGWTWDIDGTPATISYVSGGYSVNSYMVVRFASKVSPSSTSTISYNSASGDVEDTNNDALASFTDTEVTNSADAAAISYNSLVGLGGNTPHESEECDFRFDETTGTTLNDSSPNGLDGTIAGMGANPTTTTGPGYDVSAFSFDGSDDQIDLGTISRSVFATFNRASGTFWVKSSDTANVQAVFGNFDGANTGDAGMYAMLNYSSTQGQLAVITRYSGNLNTTSGYVAGDTGITDGNWHHVGYTSSADSNELRVWIDGEEQTVTMIQENAEGTAFDVQDNNHFVGARNNDGTVDLRLTGAIAQLRLFSECLPEAYILEDYAGPEPVNTVAPSLTIDANSYSLGLGTWALPAPYAGQANGTLSYDWEIRRVSDNEAVASGTNATSSPSGSGSFLGDYYAWVRGKNDGGYDSNQDAISSIQSVAGGARQFLILSLLLLSVPAWRCRAMARAACVLVVLSLLGSPVQAANSYNELFGLGSHSEDADLVGWWELQDAAANTTVADSSSNSLTGTLNGGDNTTTISTTGPGGRWAKALNFDGSADYVSTSGTEAAAVWSGKTGISILARVKQDNQTAQQTHVGNWEGTAFDHSGSYFNIATNGILQWRCATRGTNEETNASSTTDPNLDDGSWHTFAAIHQLSSTPASNTMVFRVDKSSLGVSYNEQTQAQPDFDNSSWTYPFAIGARNLVGTIDQFFDGAMADVVIFSRAITTAEADQWADGPEPTYISSVSWGTDGTFNVGTWNTQSNGTLSYEVVAANAAGTVIDSTTGSSGDLDISAENGNTVYLLVRASNDGGYDIGDDATRTSGYGSANDGYYELAIATASDGGGGSPVTVFSQQNQ